MPIPLIRKLQAAFPNAWFADAYGLTETVSGDTFLDKAKVIDKIGSVGKPVAHLELRVVDGNGRDVPPDSTGEIVLRGPKVFKGYWRQEQATREAFIEHDGKRFFRTGDLGYYDDEGYFFITDRLKRMINASGFKVWPAEVEAMLYAHPGIKEACVIGAPDGYRGETVKAVIVPRSPDVKPEEIIEWARGRMAAFKVPRLVQFVDQLPKTATGKILWRELQEKERAK